MNSKQKKRSASNGPSSKKAKFMNGIGDAELVDDVSSLLDAKEEIARYQQQKTLYFGGSGTETYIL